MKSFIQFVSRSLFFFFPFSCQATKTICSATATYTFCLFVWLPVWRYSRDCRHRHSQAVRWTACLRMWAHTDCKYSINVASCKIIKGTLTSLPDDTSRSSAGPEASGLQGLLLPEPSQNVPAFPKECGHVGSTLIFAALIYEGAPLCLKVPSFRPLVLRIRVVLTHWGRVTQICVFTLQLCKTDEENLRF
jgi:hypothetical protein